MGILAPVGFLRTRDPVGWRCPRVGPVSPGARIVCKHAWSGDCIALPPHVPPDLFVARHADHHVGGTLLHHASLLQVVRRRVESAFSAQPATAFPYFCCTALLISFLCLCTVPVSHFDCNDSGLKSEEDCP